MKPLSVGIVVVSFPLGVLLTALVRRYALHAGVLDVPNARSSHTQVTPRGGGLSIAVLFLAGVALLTWSGEVDWRPGVALLGGGLLIAAVGWGDDRHPLPVVVRAAAHLVAAAWALAWLGGLPSVSIGWGRLPLGPLGWVLGVLGIAWMTNLYNFMDGVDGLAGGEAVSVGALAGLLELAAGFPGLAALSWLLASASAGFLWWNWPPARIFMGDVSSGLLGFAFAVLGVASERAGAIPLFVWLILLGVFVVDATVTLLRRVARGEPWHEAHRTHAYQLAVQAGFSHRRVTLTVLGLNLGLGVLAGAAVRWPRLLPAVALAAGAGLLWLQVRTVRRFTPAGAPRRRALGAGAAHGQ